MAKKTKKPLKKPILKVVKEAPPENHHPEVMRLDELTREKLLRLDAEMRAAQDRATVQAAALNAYIKQIDPNGRMQQLQAEVINLRNLYAQKAQAYTELCEEVSKKFGINMQEYAFDDATGVLTPLPPSPTPAQNTEEAPPTVQ